MAGFGPCPTVETMASRPPGLTLLASGIVLLAVIRPLVDGIWVIGGMLAGLSLGIGVLATIGGAYLLIRSRTGVGR